MDIPIPAPTIFPRPSLPVPHPADSLPTPHPTPHPESPLPTPQPDLPAPTDELPTHSPMPPTYTPPLPNIPLPPPPQPAEQAEVDTAILSGGERPPVKRQRGGREDDMSRLLQRIVRQFPPCRFVAAYGSAVFDQLDPPTTAATTTQLSPAPLRSITSAPPMLDLLFVVDDPLDFHTANLALHSSHYSFLKHFGGAHTITSVNALRPYLYYNTNVHVPAEHTDGESSQSTQLIKYGVISVDRVTQDLTCWNTLYTAGRMQKPIRILQHSPSLTPHLASNLSSALTVACYLAPGIQGSAGGVQLSEVELYTLLTSLSYMGDVRMGIAEDPMKIVRIVTGSYPHFQSLYSPHITQCEWLEDIDSSDSGMRRWRVKNSEADRRRMVDALPSHLYDTLALGGGGGGDGRVRWEGVGMAEQQARMRAGLASIVRRSSWQQSMKGVLTAGVRKGLWYTMRKVVKAWK